MVRKAQAAILWERLWPKAAPTATVGGAFLTASWLGLWAALPPVATAATVIAMAATAAALPFRVKTGSLLVSENDALKRLDDNIGEPGQRPARTLRDHINERSSQLEKDLWDTHLNRMWNKWGGKFEAGLPKPGLSLKRYFVMSALAVSTAISGFMAGDERLERLSDAFNWSAPTVPVAPTAIKAWITPPENIDRKPLYLTEKTLDHNQGGARLIAHTNSAMTINIYDDNARLFVNGAEITERAKISNDPQKPGYQYELMLTEENTTIHIENGPIWQLLVTPDGAPSVKIDTIGVEDNKEDGSKPIKLKSTAKDDHGLQGGQVIIKPVNPDPEADPLPAGTVPPINLPVYKQ